MTTIWKFLLMPVPSSLPAFYDDLLVPIGARFVHCGVQAGRVCLWAVVETQAPVMEVAIGITGTGQPCPPSSEYIGTLQINDGWVLHVFWRWPREKSPDAGRGAGPGSKSPAGP